MALCFENVSDFSLLFALQSASVVASMPGKPLVHAEYCQILCVP